MSDDYINDELGELAMIGAELARRAASIGRLEEYPVVDDELQDIGDSVGYGSIGMEPVFDAHLAPFQATESEFVGMEPVFRPRFAPFQGIGPEFVGMEPVFDENEAPFEAEGPVYVGVDPIYIGAQARLGSGARFARLRRKLLSQGAHDPEALAAWIGRRKYGAKKMALLAAAGRRRQLRALGY